jgi:hypothetical protein
VRITDIGLAELVSQGRGPEQVAALARRRGSQLGGAGQRRHRGGHGTTAGRPVGDQLEFGGDGLVVTGRRPGTVQNSTVGSRADGSRQRQVPGHPAARRHDVVHRRSHQPVAEPQLIA